MRQRSPSPDSQGEQRDLMAPLLPEGEPVESLLRKAQFFTPGTPSQDYRELHRRGGRGAEEFYRERWRHDKEVRSTHGVNCTGSCSWKVYVKDGIITWETQQTDYPSVGPDSPEYEPRGTAPRAGRLTRFQATLPTSPIRDDAGAGGRPRPGIQLRSVVALGTWATLRTAAGTGYFVP